MVLLSDANLAENCLFDPIEDFSDSDNGGRASSEKSHLPTFEGRVFLRFYFGYGFLTSNIFFYFAEMIPAFIANTKRKGKASTSSALAQVSAAKDKVASPPAKPSSWASSAWKKKNDLHSTDVEVIEVDLLWVGAETKPNLFRREAVKDPDCGYQAGTITDIRMPFCIKSNRTRVYKTTSKIGDLILKRAKYLTELIFYPPNTAVQIPINLAAKVTF